MAFALTIFTHIQLLDYQRRNITWRWSLAIIYRRSRPHSLSLSRSPSLSLTLTHFKTIQNVINCDKGRHLVQGGRCYVCVRVQGKIPVRFIAFEGCWCYTCIYLFIFQDACADQTRDSDAIHASAQRKRINQLFVVSMQENRYRLGRTCACCRYMLGSPLRIDGFVMGASQNIAQSINDFKAIAPHQNHTSCENASAIFSGLRIEPNYKPLIPLLPTTSKLDRPNTFGTAHWSHCFLCVRRRVHTENNWKITCCRHIDNRKLVRCEAHANSIVGMFDLMCEERVLSSGL